MRYGLIGHPLGHSFSKEIHESIADYTYELFDLDENAFHEFMEKRDFRAVNVTIPYKQAVIPYLDVIDETAEAIGAVNTVVNINGSLFGYNTDAPGLKELILRNTDTLEGKTVLILGTGGTSKTARYVAASLGAEKIYTASRSKAGEGVYLYGDLDKIADSIDVLINTTPVGMFPNMNAEPVDIDMFKNLSCVIDAVYNPLRTSLVLSAKEKKIPAEGGLYMLVSQAVYAIEYFLGRKLDKEIIEKTFKRVVRARQNVVLTGMPGSGKSVIGDLLSKETGLHFSDTDELITEKYSHPAELITKYGEECFRDIEAEIIADISKVTGHVIATGGGAILRAENIKNLKKNGKIYFIERDLAAIVPTEDRPLSSTRERLTAVYNDRIGKYMFTCDRRIMADGGPDVAVKMIIREMDL